MTLPIGDANRRLMQAIKEDEKLYTLFRATEAFADLERELQAFDQE